MKLQLAARGIDLPAELKDYLRRRAHFSLGRFAGRIRTLSIRLADANGPRGGIDKLCNIRVDLGLNQDVIVCERQANFYAAIAFAMERSERAVVRQLKLGSTGKRISPLRTAEFGS